MKKYKREITEEATERNTEERWDTELEVKKSLTETKLKDKENVTSDWTLATLQTREEDYAINSYDSANQLKSIIERIGEKTKDKEEKEKIKEIATDLYKTIMRKTEVMMVLKRNKDGNYLVNRLTENQEEETRKEKEEENGWMEKLKTALTPKKEN